MGQALTTLVARQLLAPCAAVVLCALLSAGAGAQPAGDAPLATGPTVQSVTDKTIDTVVVVVDASGSMKESLPGAGTSKMEAAKTALLGVLSKVPAGTNVGVLVFSGQNVGEEWVYPIGPLDQDQLRRAIAPIQPDGGTPLGAYIKKAADALLARRAQQSGYGTFSMLVVTDGEASDRDLMEKYTPVVLARGIVVNVIGVNMKADHTLAKKVHSYKRANDPASLNAAVTEVFAELKTRSTDDNVAANFEMIKAIPDEVAAAALTAITAQQNQPVGEAPVPPAGAVGTPAAAPTQSNTNANPGNSARNPATSNQSPVPSAPSSGGPGTLPWAIIGGVIVVIVLSKIARAVRGASS
ncbi:MAG: vWA domain-containing protein [Phycisphaerales bacterium]